MLRYASGINPEYSELDDLLNDSNLKPIKKNLQKAVRKILFKNRNQPTEPLFDELKVLDFDKHKFLTISSFMWQLTYDNIPDTIKSSLNIRNRDYGVNNRKYHIPNISSEILKRNIVYQGPKIWNNLKNDIKTKNSILSFKNTLKKKLLEKDSQLQFFRTLYHP